MNCEYNSEQWISGLRCHHVPRVAKKRSARRAGPMDGLENFMSAKIWAINLRLKKTPVTFLVNIKIGGKMEGNLPNHSF